MLYVFVMSVFGVAATASRVVVYICNICICVVWIYVVYSSTHDDYVWWCRWGGGGVCIWKIEKWVRNRIRFPAGWSLSIHRETSREQRCHSIINFFFKLILNIVINKLKYKYIFESQLSVKCLLKSTK